MTSGDSSKKHGGYNSNLFGSSDLYQTANFAKSMTDLVTAKARAAAPPKRVFASKYKNLV